jgi:SAM-dependent methyltransferase
MTEPPHLHATRDAYDAVAGLYAECFAGSLAERPLDRSLITAFGELVRADGGGPVADLGCGPGYVTAYLHSLGLSAFGVDLSPEMVALARQAHPGLRFETGSMTALDVADGALGGVLSRHSVIHTPPELLPEVFAEFRRMLAPGGRLLLSFFAGDDPRRLAEPFDHRVAPAYRLSPDGVAGLLRRAGLSETARLVREPEEDERFRQAYVLARRPV